MDCQIIDQDNVGCKKNVRCRTEVRSNFFTNRVPEHWNKLPEELKNARNIKTFKTMYDELHDIQSLMEIAKKRCHYYAPIGPEMTNLHVFQVSNDVSNLFTCIATSVGLVSSC